MSDSDFTVLCAIFGILGGCAVVLGATWMFGALGLLVCGAAILLFAGWLWFNHVMVEEIVEARKR